MTFEGLVADFYSDSAFQESSFHLERTIKMDCEQMKLRHRQIVSLWYFAFLNEGQDGWLTNDDYLPAVKSVPASWAVFKNSSRSRSWVMDCNREVGSTSVEYCILCQARSERNQGKADISSLSSCLCILYFAVDECLSEAGSVLAFGWLLVTRSDSSKGRVLEENTISYSTYRYFCLVFWDCMLIRTVGVGTETRKSGSTGFWRLIIQFGFRNK